MATKVAKSKEFFVHTFGCLIFVLLFKFSTPYFYLIWCISNPENAKTRSLHNEFNHATISLVSSGDLDNTPIIEQILNLRLKKVEILNYKIYDEVFFIIFKIKCLWKSGWLSYFQISMKNKIPTLKKHKSKSIVERVRWKV